MYSFWALDVYNVISSIQRYGCRDAYARSDADKRCISISDSVSGDLQKPRFKRCFGKNLLKMTCFLVVCLKIISPRCVYGTLLIFRRYPVQPSFVPPPGGSESEKGFRSTETNPETNG